MMHMGIHMLTIQRPVVCSHKSRVHKSRVHKSRGTVKRLIVIGVKMLSLLISYKLPPGEMTQHSVL